MKAFWRSKTIWFQILSVAVAVSGSLPLPGDVIAALVGCINVGLRLITSAPVSLGGSNNAE
jgi:hypothetical protein